MTEMTQVIAEAEGIRTPTRKRTKAELKQIHEDYVAKKAAKKKTTKKAPAAVTPKPTPAKNADAKPAPVYAEPIAMNFISPTGYVREAGYDPKTKLFHIAFGKSTWAMPSNADEWASFEKAVADPLTEIDAYYRKMARGRTGEMLAVRKSEVTA